MKRAAASAPDRTASPPSAVGSAVGSTVGSIVGSTVGSTVGSIVGSTVGSVLGVSVLSGVASFSSTLWLRSAVRTLACPSTSTSFA
ncbi:glycine zipper domain-containing protein [Flavonifractor sp. DFI.6.63]|uniref:glycine zipper domain-containing protein n=1 Tax=Flavonifractor sp. DFI.6.63 TaxID=2963704 RepID=UPI003521A751